ncbi:type IV pilus modification protein PilV [Acinetobacter colistiniresistens]|uniref:Type IV pilus modification protein PilV n=1 Tax=Acinetobacter colistiniresistens TaxID=280145 RepID=N9QT15_9GAMM|nr:type IV pilus modification protein PilV [Acinetobacter colistiniresistens]ENX33186.1 type IV pilus modification protein PilV [Acinetobacter colistiniresistens]
MNTLNRQRGVGLVEILVALLVLAIGVLGFVALQYRSLEASAESTSRVQAITLARDLAERIRVNRNSFDTYQTELSTATKQKTSTKKCIGSVVCTDAELADFDIAQVTTRAATFGMTMNIMNCQNTNNRQCIYVAWGESSATNGTGTGDCTNGNTYNPTSTCVIMEAY